MVMILVFLTLAWRPIEGSERSHFSHMYVLYPRCTCTYHAWQGRNCTNRCTYSTVWCVPFTARVGTLLADALVRTLSQILNIKKPIQLQNTLDKNRPEIYIQYMPTRNTTFIWQNLTDFDQIWLKTVNISEIVPKYPMLIFPGGESALPGDPRRG